MKTKDLTTIAFMTAILVVLGLIPGIPLGIIPVPIVLQNMGVMLASLILKPKHATMSIFLLLLLAALGLPVLSGGRGGLPILLGPTAGYMFSWLLTPFLIYFGLSFLKNKKSITLKLLVVWLAGVICSDLIGTIWLTIQSQVPFMTALFSNLAFLPGDTIKLILAFTMAKALKAQPFSENTSL